ncbi:MAG: potassium transporter TrkG [Methanocorpusculum sp.]|nr:potassium transporter TrkG [Methanocorpusculum sp.]
MGLLQELRAVGRDAALVLLFFGCASLIPIGVSALFQEWSMFPWITVPALIFFAAGAVLRIMPKTQAIPHGTLSISAAALLWPAIALICAVPYFAIGLDIIDAAFESMSSWTGTSFTIASSPESWPKTLLFWRSFMQWLGGLSIVAFAMAVAGRSAFSGREMPRIEGRGATLIPNIISAGRRMGKIYGVLTLAAVVLILLTGVGLWDAVNLALSAASTGGMTMYADGIAHYENTALELVLIPIILLAAVPFRLYYIAASGRSLKWLMRDTILRLILLCFAAAAVYMIVYLTLSGMPVADAIHQGLFTSANIVSTAGFQNTAIGALAPGALLVLSLFVLTGGGAESTAGGFKLSRVQVMFEALVWWFKKNMLSPRAVIFMRHNGRPVAAEEAGGLVAKSLLTIILYIVFAVAVLFVLLHDPYFSANIPAALYDVCSCFAVSGSSAGLIGPDMPDYAKVLLFFVLWAARLEIIPVLLLLRGIARGFRMHVLLQKPGGMPVREDDRRE